ncbi:MAG: hypothetical protein KY445_01710 [Armatimonadetes bacterium]|nr:hypothetical protein [Armatimonadota bacterium]
MWQFLGFLGWSFAGVAAGLLAQILFVPLIVRVVGEKHFAKLSLFDIGTLCVAGGIGGVVASVLPHPFLWLGILQLGLILYGLFWLWSAGRGAGGKEWEIVGERSVRRLDGGALQPLFLWQRQDYHQTDAFHGYSHYFLELHDESGRLARNGYRSETEKDAEKAALFALLPTLRALDLVLVCRVEPLWWSVATFLDPWTPLLCGPLNQLSEDERQWWRQWLAPQFDITREILIDAAQWRAHLGSLSAAYPDFWRQAARRAVEEKQIMPQFETSEYWSWPHQLREIEITLSQTEAPVLAMSGAVFQTSARQAIGENGGTMGYNFEQREGFVKLIPR